MQCLFYDECLKKTVPCLLVPNQVYTINNQKYCKVLFDSSLYSQYNITQNDVSRYCSDSIKLMDIYPARTQDEIDYALLCIPNNTNISDFINKELSRLLKIITMIVSGQTVRSNVFYQLSDFISYEILFKYCTQNDRIFMLGISNNLLSGLPSNILAQYVICMTKQIFDNYPNDNTTTYYIQNYNNLVEFSYLTFPLPINIPILVQNIDLLYPEITLPY